MERAGAFGASAAQHRIVVGYRVQATEAGQRKREALLLRASIPGWALGKEPRWDEVAAYIDRAYATSLRVHGGSPASISLADPYGTEAHFSIVLDRHDFAA